MPFSSVLCAVDASNQAARVVRHAAGLAALAGGRLTVLTITDGDRGSSESRLESLISTLPSGIGLAGEPRVRVGRVTQGRVADGILEFAREGTDLIVLGSHARGEFSRWLLGSTSAACLEQAPCPVCLLPPSQVDVITLAPGSVTLNFGAVIAAVDLDEHNDAQLRLAGRLAGHAGQPLVLMTVAPPAMTDQDAEQALAARGAIAAPAAVEHLVVRRGTVAEEISRAAAAEPAHLVVMGLREPGHGRPGGLATQVLHGKDTVVLAVPAVSGANQTAEPAV